MAETVLVTGGTGFVGGWCVAELLRREYTVRTTVRSLESEFALREAIATVVEPGGRLTVHAADLMSDHGWAEAIAGCDYVIHPASPIGPKVADNADAFIVPARDGVLRVLRAATAARVRRVVMTSACTAASPPPGSRDQASDESVWADASLPSLSHYQRSKAIAERIAWDFMATYDGPTTLATVLPGAIFGPALTVGSYSGSVQVIGRLLDGSMSVLPRLPFQVVDVRDLADAHIRSMTNPAAVGRRFIAVGDTMWLSDIARILRTGLGVTASQVPTRTVPDVVVRLMSRFDPKLRGVVASLGRKHRYSSASAREVLGWTTRPGAETVLDCARGLLAARPAG